MKSKVIQGLGKSDELFYQNHDNCKIEEHPIQG